MSITPLIEPNLADLAPGFLALSIQVTAGKIVRSDIGAKILQQACQTMLTNDVAWADDHLAAWAEVFKKFGAKPQRTPCSAEALRKRVLRDGNLPNIDPIVDLYNAISIQYAIPVGGENLAAYQGIPHLKFASGEELFDTMKDGQVIQESPEKGEVIWCDDLGVTCRRWNWRQGIRTRLDSNAQQMWFILESLPAMPLEALHEAGEQLTQGISLMMPEAIINSQKIGY